MNVKQLIIAVSYLITGAALALLALAVAGLLWYSPESGWCWGTLAQCINR